MIIKRYLSYNNESIVSALQTENAHLRRMLHLYDITDVA